MSASGPATYAHGPWEIDLARRELRLHGVRIPLGQRAFVILDVLLHRSGEAVSRAELMQAAWPEISVEANTLEVHILALRRAFGEDRGLLRTVRGRGYLLQGAWRPRVEAALEEGGNLPPTEGALLGRQQALLTVLELLRQHRLVTLTGSPGIGKTRLAIEAARHFAQESGLTAFLVDLTTVVKPWQVPGVVAQALRPVSDPGAWGPEPLAEALTHRNALLLLDGCEHVVAETARLVHLIVTRCAGIRVLVTGRDTLRIDGEQVWRVPALEPLPDGKSSCHEPSAVALFLDRMQQAGAPPVTDADDLRRIGEICRRLDGLPLAIEWAAFRTASLGIEAVLSGLPTRLLSLGSSQRSAPSRHRTLRAALDWSSDRLTETERRLMRRLGIFGGHFTLIEALAVAGEDLTDDEVIEGIVSLVEQSILLRDEGAAGRSWYFLETTRAYALEQLAAAGEVEATEARHAAQSQG
ncbi:ATP-binding protein [Roseomonas sp. F4]